VVAKADWSDEAVLSVVRQRALPAIERHGAIRAWIIDDTGFPKKGTHSVGVARQYCGQLGKQDNCQVAVSLSVANDHASLPIAYRLYLPQAWADDHVAGIQSSTSVWAPGTAPKPPKRWSGNGRPPKLIRRDAVRKPVSAKELALSLPKQQWHRVTWREGSNAKLTSHFAAVRVRPAHRDYNRTRPRPEEWCLIEWPKGEAEPTKYWLSTLPADMPLRDLVDLAKLRWRIERDYQELKQELGLGHYEGRGWRGFHHHATLTIAAYGFLIAERSAIPPSAAPIFKTSALPHDYRPRGSPYPT
jgi:SRSO17 transposase